MTCNCTLQPINICICNAIFTETFLLISVCIGAGYRPRKFNIPFTSYSVPYYPVKPRFQFIADMHIEIETNGLSPVKIIIAT